MSILIFGQWFVCLSKTITLHCLYASSNSTSEHAGDGAPQLWFSWAVLRCEEEKETVWQEKDVKNRKETERGKEIRMIGTTEAALLENNEASANLTTANGGTFTSSSARLSSQSRYSTLDQWLTCFNVILVTETGWARRERSAICGGKSLSASTWFHMT